jgi:hypothetical protein
MYLTLQESATDYTYTHYLFKLTHRLSGAEHFFVADVSVDNPRYTAVDVVTDTDDTNNVLLVDAGFYEYEVYVQTSSTNLDPANATALIEQGLLQVTGPDITTTPTISASDNFVYNGN